MHDAILFFDECESMFAQRGRGGSADLTDLLTEMEVRGDVIIMELKTA